MSLLLSRSAPKSSRSLDRRRFRPAIEPLETRLTPAFTAVFAAGILTVTSNDAAADVITIDDADANGTIDVNGTDVAGATFGATTSIVFDNVAGTGRDVVTIDPTNNTVGFDTIPATMSAGTNGDTLDTSAVGAAGVVLNGGAGPDFLIGGGGNDQLSGLGGTDNLQGNGGGDTLSGGAGNDTAQGGAGNDLLQGDGDNDQLDGDAGSDTFSGGSGDDDLIWDPGDGSDVMDGDAGDDALVFNGGNGIDTFAMTAAAGGRLRFDRQPGNIVIDAGTVERVDVNRDFVFNATLTGAQEVPPVTPAGTGTATMRFYTTTNRFDLDLTVQDLTSAIQMAHIHAAPVGVNGPIIVDLLALGSFVSNGTSQRLTIRDALFPAANVADLLAGNTYINVHTTNNPTGEVRGQLLVGNAGTGGADAFLVNDLTGTTVSSVRLGLGQADGGAADTVAVNGTPLGDDIDVSLLGGTVLVSGVSAPVQVTNAVAANDQLVVNGNAGDDSITAAAGVATTLPITLDGGAGQDSLTGSGTLIGGAGNDTAQGGAGNDTLVGDGGLIAVIAPNQLVRFSATSPGTVIATVPITNLLGGDTIQGIDFRPATGQLYGLGVSGATGRLYVIDPNSGFATLVGPGPFSTTLTGTRFGFDFNPTVDLIRVVSDTEENFRLHPDTGLLLGPDTPLTPAGNVVGSAYDRNAAGATLTTLFGIDSVADTLVRQGGVDGTPSPNGGALTTIGALGVNTSDNVGFDITAGGTAYAALTLGGVSQLFTINLTTGAATLVGNIGDGDTVRGLAAAPGEGSDVLSPGGGTNVVDGGAGSDVALVPGIGSTNTLLDVETTAVLPPLPPPPPPPPPAVLILPDVTDITNRVRIVPAAIRRRGGRIQLVVSVQNASGQGIQGALALLLTNLRRRNRLLNGQGVSLFVSPGSSFVVALAGGDGVFSAGEVVQFTLQFSGDTPLREIRNLVFRVAGGLRVV